MALRSGYKGFKKLLPGLKLFRPGTLGIDNDVLIPEFNKTFFPRSEQVMLGAKNFWVTDFFTTKTQNGYTFTVDPDTKKIHITGRHDSESAGVTECGVIHLEAGSYKLSGGIGGTAGKLAIQVWASSEVSDQWANVGTGDTDIVLTTAKDCKLRIWYSGVIGEGNIDVTFEPMIRLASDPDNTYVPPVMTNKKITEMLEIVNGTYDFDDTESTTTPSAHTGRTVVRQYGKLCIFTFHINSVTLAATNIFKVLMTIDKRPIGQIPFVVIVGDNDSEFGMLDTDGKLFVEPKNGISNSPVRGEVVFFTND